MLDMVGRTRRFALRCLKTADALPRNAGARTIASQLARSGTGTAANYRTSQVARSKAEFCSKLQIALEEADETQFWLGLAAEAGYLPAATLQNLAGEAAELTAILVASLKAARRNK
jgi:four helix bundle protein